MITLSKNSIDLTGQTFGYWTAQRPVGKTKHGSIIWLCQCKCGTSREVDGQSLRKGLSKSCRCSLHGINKIHGETTNKRVTPEYIAYHTARGHCNNPRHPRFKDWGGRGVEFRFESFGEFLQEIGRKPSKMHSLNRIDNNGHYEKGNVEWATFYTQNRNRRNATAITVNGITKTIPEWSVEFHIKPSTIRSRLFMYGWCATCAVTLPVKDGIRQCWHRVTDKN